jgi:fructose-1,6-bisphosphatase II
MARANGSVTDHDDDHLAIRLAQLDWSRATEQTAIIMALLVGRGPERRRSRQEETEERAKARAQTHRGAFFEGKATASLRGYLHSTYCNGQAGWPSDKSRWSFGNTSAPEEWNLQCLFRAVDSGDDLKDGDGGVLSVVAGGRVGAFLPQAANQNYVVIVTPEGGAEYLAAARGADAGTGDIHPRVTDVLERIRRKSKEKLSPFTIGTRPVTGQKTTRAHNPLLKGVQSDIPRFSRMQVLTGSPIAGAVTACWPHFGIDAYFAVVTAVQASLLATLAYTMKGGFVALPLAADDAASVSGVEFLGTEAFIKTGEDVFLVATGITDHPILEGVRFRGDDVVSTHTLCCRSLTRSARFISHLHRLDAKTFHLAHNPDADITEVALFRGAALFEEIKKWLGYPELVVSQFDELDLLEYRL